MNALFDAKTRGLSAKQREVVLRSIIGTRYGTGGVLHDETLENVVLVCNEMKERILATTELAQGVWIPNRSNLAVYVDEETKTKRISFTFWMIGETELDGVIQAVNELVPVSHL